MKITLRMVAFACMAIPAVTASADTMFWTGAVNNVWGNPGNWQGNRVPGANDFAIIQPGPVATVSGFTRVNTLFVQPGATLLVQSQIEVLGGASIQGNLFISGAPATFTHTSDVSLYGNLEIWDGAAIYRSQNATGTFTVYEGANFTIPAIDTRGVTLGTALNVRGVLRHNASSTISVGRWTSDRNPSSYIAVGQFGNFQISAGGDLAPTVSSGQVEPYIVNEGIVQTAGATIDVINISPGLGLFNAGLVSIDRADMHIGTSRDISANETLRRGAWSCREFGRIFFDSHSLTGIDAGVVVQYVGSGSAIPSLSNLNEINGRLLLQNGVHPIFYPQGGSLSNRGDLIMDSSAQVVVEGLFYNRAEGALDMGVVGLDDGQHARISAMNIALDGRFVATFANGFDAAKGSTIQMLLATNLVSGRFSSTQMLWARTPFKVDYTFGTVDLVAGCVADFNGDEFLDFFDYDDFVQCFESGNCPPGRDADFNRDGFLDFFDYDEFVSVFETGC